MIGITVDTFNNTAVLYIRGQLKLGKETIQAREKFAQVIGRRTIILDVSAVDKIDCAGLGELVRLAAQIRAAGGIVYMQGVTRQLSDLLVICRLLTAFPSIDIDLPRAA
jgi:anti-anti-sigma factor